MVWFDNAVKTGKRVRYQVLPDHQPEKRLRL